MSLTSLIMKNMLIPLEFVRSIRARLEGLLSAFFLAKEMSALTRVIIILPSNLKHEILFISLMTTSLKAKPIN